MEQPTRTTIYRGGTPGDDQINRTPYNQREKELKDLQNNYQEDNLQRENSREVVDEQRVRQLSYPESPQEELSQEGGEEGSYEEETEEVNNQHVPPRQHYREQGRQINPQRNVGIYIQQELPQQKQIPVEVHPQFFYQRDHSENIQPYQKEILQKENSGEVVTREQLTQYRPESSPENLYNQDKATHYRTVPHQNFPQREYTIPNYQQAARNVGGQIHIVSPRPHAIHDNQYSTQHYSAKEYTNKKPVIYQPNVNVRETRPMIQQQINVQQQNHHPQYQQNPNNHRQYIPDPRLIHNEKKHQNVNIYKPQNEYTNIQQQQRPTNYGYHQVAPKHLQPTHQPHHETAQKYETRYHQHYAPQNTQLNYHQTSEQPRIRHIIRRQKRQTSSGLPLSSQFRSLLSRLYTPVGSPSSNHLNNFQNFISSSIPSSEASETSRNPTQHRPTNYFPQQYHYNPRYQSPYNSDAQTLYDRSPVYSNPQFQQTPYYYQPPNRPPLTSYPNNFRYYDDNGEHLNQNIRNNPQRPTDGVPSPPKPATSAEQDDSSNKPTASDEQVEVPQQSDVPQNKQPTYPPLPTINPQNFPELKDFPFFNNPSYPYSQNGNDSSKDTENSQYSYNRIPPSRYHVPDLGVYFDPYGEFGVTPLYEPSQTNSDDTKDPDSTESPAIKEQSEENEGKKEDSSRRRVPGRIKRPQNTLLNAPYDDKNHPDKPRGDLFVTSPPNPPVNTYNPRSVNLFVTPPSYLVGHSRAPSVFGPEFFVPPLRPPLTTESTPKDIPDKHVTQQDDSLETSEVTTPTPSAQVTTPVQRQRGHRRRPQSTTRPKQGTRGTTRHPSASRSSSRHTSSERDSPRHSSESIRPPSQHSQPSRPTTRRPTSTRPPNRTPVRERPKPVTLPSVRPTQKPSSESDSSDDGEPNPFRGSVPYGTRLRRPPPSRQTSSQLSHERKSTVKKIEQSSASDRSFTIARKEPRERPHRIQSVERSHQPRRATNQFRETTTASTSSTTYQTPPWTELRSRNIFRYSNEEGTTVGYSPNDEEDEHRVRRPSVRRATYIRKNQDIKPEIKPKLFRGRTRARNYHPRRGFAQATTQSTTTTSEAVTTPMTTTSTTKSPSPVIHMAAVATTTTSTTTTTPKPKPTSDTPKPTTETIIVETEPTQKLRVYTSRHGGSLRNERVINRLKDKPRLFTFGRPRGGTADDSNFDETNYATESSSES